MSYNIIFPLYIHALKCVKESPVSIFKVKDCQLSRTEKKEYIWKKIFHSISLTIIIKDISFSKRLIRFYSIIFILHLSTLKIFFYFLMKLQIKIFLLTNCGQNIWGIKIFFLSFFDSLSVNHEKYSFYIGVLYIVKKKNKNKNTNLR